MWLVTGATGHVGNVLVRKLLKHGEKVQVLILPYSLEMLQSNSNISHVKATHELGYSPRSLYESIKDAAKWFLEKKK
jgi:nucleoside-diphosphate-sugar epimerase